jgi:hypothetical protein
MLKRVIVLCLLLAASLIIVGSIFGDAIINRDFSRINDTMISTHHISVDNFSFTFTLIMVAILILVAALIVAIPLFMPC